MVPTGKVTPIRTVRFRVVCFDQYHFIWSNTHTHTHTHLAGTSVLGDRVLGGVGLPALAVELLLDHVKLFLVLLRTKVRTFMCDDKKKFLAKNVTKNKRCAKDDCVANAAAKQSAALASSVSTKRNFAHVHTYTDSHTHTHKRTHSSNTHTYTYASVTYRSTGMRTHTRAQTHTHASTQHTHTHIHTQRRTLCHVTLTARSFLRENEAAHAPH